MNDEIGENAVANMCPLWIDGNPRRLTFSKQNTVIQRKKTIFLKCNFTFNGSKITNGRKIDKEC
tara:strand:- start:195 stop:386 length:192 start_codon:yes stop_codon:yes gene_type:complete